LNELLHPDCQLTNIDRTLEMMDFDGSGTIDINEFFEVSEMKMHFFPKLRLIGNYYRLSVFWMLRMVLLMV
jgi:hypothetical protein